MATDSAGNDLGAVGVPITGFLAICFEVVKDNVLTDKQLGANPLALEASKWSYAGLFKEDGGFTPASETEDAIVFFQQGYELNGLRTDTFKVGLAEDNKVVDRLVYGKTANSDGVIYVDAADPDATFLAVSMTQFKNGVQERRHGVARVSSIEVDQEERGSVKGRSVTFKWVPDPLFNGSPYKVWKGKPGSAPVSGGEDG